MHENKEKIEDLEIPEIYENDPGVTLEYFRESCRLRKLVNEIDIGIEILQDAKKQYGDLITKSITLASRKVKPGDVASTTSSFLAELLEIYFYIDQNLERSRSIET